MDALLKGKGQTFFDALPAWFLDPSASSKTSTPDNNILVDPIRGRKIRLCTIHAVKGQTHDATLFLETEKNRGSDLARILWCYGIGKPGQSSLFEYSRKLAYVGFSRPKKLLCVAIQESTYEKCKKQFHNKLWEVVDVRQWIMGLDTWAISFNRREKYEPWWRYLIYGYDHRRRILHPVWDEL